MYRDGIVSKQRRLCFDFTECRLTFVFLKCLIKVSSCVRGNIQTHNSMKMKTVVKRILLKQSTRTSSNSQHLACQAFSLAKRSCSENLSFEPVQP